MRQRLDRLDQGTEGRDVVAVVDHDRRAVDLQQVEPAGYGVDGRAERLQAVADGVEVEPEGPGGARGGQRVLDLEADPAAVGQGDVGQAAQAGLAGPLGQHDLAVPDDHRPAAPGAVGGDDRVVGIAGRRRSTEPRQYGAIAATSGSSALRTAAPVGETASTMIRLTRARSSSGLDAGHARGGPPRRCWSRRPRRSGRSRAPRGGCRRGRSPARPPRPSGSAGPSRRWRGRCNRRPRSGGRRCRCRRCRSCRPTCPTRAGGGR